MSRFPVCFVIVWIAAASARAAFLIPSANGPLTIDGAVDEPFWKSAAILPREAGSFGTVFPSAGETRAAVRGNYLCLSAMFPESERIVARSTGQNPVWWREDMVVWTVHFRAFATSISVSVNPLGAYRIDTSRLPGKPKEPVLASASIGKNEWSAEVAIPISDIESMGFISAERVRVPRPDAPELRWSWPGANRRLAYQLAPADAELASPAVVNRVLASDRGAIKQSREPHTPGIVTIPENVWTGSEREALGVDNMWDKNLHARVEKAAQSERQAWERVKSAEDWEQFRNPRISALKASLRAFPERTPLRSAVTRRVDYGDGFVVENLLFESRPGLVVAANLYLPSARKAPVPAIVVIHSHHAPKTHWELQDLGMTWARAGAAVLVMDQLGAGERLQSQPWPRESYYSRNALGVQLYLAGESLMKWMVWDTMRGIDVLLERPYIDTKRIVMLGAVAGGGDPAAVTAALDNRIAAVIPFNFGEASPEDHYTTGPRSYDRNTADPGWGEWESTRCLRLSIAKQFFPWLICASAAPRGFIYSFEIGWPHNVEDEPMWARYQKVFKLYGKIDHLAQVDGFGPFPGPGEVTHVGEYLRQKIYPILQRWLNVPVPSKEIHNPRPEEDLMCLTAAEAERRRPKTVNEIASGIAQERLSTARARRRNLPAAQRAIELRSAITAKLGDHEPPLSPEAKVLWTKPEQAFTTEGIQVVSEPGITLPILLLHPNGKGRMPIVVAFSQQGKAAFRSERRAELDALLKNGAAVCLVDVRGTGEAANPKRGSSLASLAATHLMLGDTAMGARVKDVRTVLRYLATRADIDIKRTVLWGDSLAEVNPRDLMLDQSVLQSPGPQTIHTSEPLGGLLVLLTALYEEDVRAVVAGRSLISYASVLKDRFAYVPHDVVIPGILEVADVADIIAALDHRGVRVEGAVDGRNRALTEPEMRSELRLAERGQTSPLVVENSGGPDTVNWMTAQWSK